MTTIKPYFGKKENKQSNLKALGSSMLNTGLVAGGGGAAGAAVGAIAGFLPVKPTSDKLLEELVRNKDAIAEKFVTAQDTFEHVSYYDNILENISKNKGNIKKQNLLDVMRSVGMEAEEAKSGIFGGIKALFDKTLATADEEDKVVNFIKDKRKTEYGETVLETFKENCENARKTVLEKIKSIGEDSEIYKNAKEATRSQMKAERLLKGIKWGVFIALVGSLVLSVVKDVKGNKEKAAPEQQMGTNAN